MVAAATLTEARDSDLSDTDEKREGDRSPSEDEFLSCDSSSSDRGEGDGQGSGGGGSQAETELLMADEAGRAISEKERMKDRKFSWGQQRTSSEQVDEDADVDTAMATLDHRPTEAQPPSPRSTSPCRTPGTSQLLRAPQPFVQHLLGANHRHAQVSHHPGGFSTTRPNFRMSDGLNNMSRLVPLMKLERDSEPGALSPPLQTPRGHRQGHMGVQAWVPRRCQRALFPIRPWSWLGCLAQHGPLSAPRARQ